MTMCVLPIPLRPGVLALATAGLLLTTGAMAASKPFSAQQEIESLHRQLLELQQRVNTLEAERKAAAEVGASAAAPPPAPVAQAPATETPPPSSASAALPDGKPASSKPEIDLTAALEQPTVLTPPGKLVLEPSLQYTTSSSSRVALIGYSVVPAVTIGLIDIREVTRNTWLAGIAARYGLANGLEIEGRIPYVYSSETSQEHPFLQGSSEPDVFSQHGSGIGDAELGLRYQLNHPAEGNPFYVANLRVRAPTGKGPFDVPYDSQTGLATKTPTGAGFWGVQIGGTAVLPSDPAVFFGGLSYQFNLPRDVDKTLVIQQGGVPVTQEIGRVDPGDILTLNFGMGLGLNEKSSFSIGYEHNYIGKSKINGETPKNSVTSQVGILQLGYSYRLSPKVVGNLSLGVGVTRDAPDAQLTLRLPYSF